MLWALSILSNLTRRTSNVIYIISDDVSHTNDSPHQSRCISQMIHLTSRDVQQMWLDFDLFFIYCQIFLIQNKKSWKQLLNDTVDGIRSFRHSCSIYFAHRENIKLLIVLFLSFVVESLASHVSFDKSSFMYSEWHARPVSISHLFEQSNLSHRWWVTFSGENHRV